MVSARGATWCPVYRTFGQVVDDIRVTAKGCGRDNHSLTPWRGNLHPRRGRRYRATDAD